LITEEQYPNVRVRNNIYKISSK